MDIMVIEGEPGKGTYRKVEPVETAVVIADLDALFEELFVMDKTTEHLKRDFTW